MLTAMSGCGSSGGDDSLDSQLGKACEISRTAPTPNTGVCACRPMNSENTKCLLTESWPIACTDTSKTTDCDPSSYVCAATGKDLASRTCAWPFEALLIGFYCEGGREIYYTDWISKELDPKIYCTAQCEKLQTGFGCEWYATEQG